MVTSQHEHDLIRKRLYDYKKYMILFVDDEPNARKYFKANFQDEFSVMTAANVKEAEALIQNHGESIGIVISDQRLPQASGVELLEQLSRRYPMVIRILTTAFGDVDNAIESVNSGAIYKYILKPWNIDELKTDLMRGMEFFIIQQERDMLLREKMSVLQQILISDRVRSFAIMAASFSNQIRNPLAALKRFIENAPLKLKEELPETVELKNPKFWGRFQSVAQAQTERILAIIEKLSSAVVEPNMLFESDLPMEQLVLDGVQWFNGACEKPIIVSIPEELPTFKVDKSMIKRLFLILFKQMHKLLREDEQVTLMAETIMSASGEPAARITLRGDGPAWSENRVSSLFTAFSIREDDLRDPGLDLLPAFFLIHHHAGNLLIHNDEPFGPGFEVELPFFPDRIEHFSKEEGSLKTIMTHLDMWESMRREL